MDVEAFKYPLIRSWRHVLKLSPADSVDAIKSSYYISNQDKCWFDEA